MKGEIVDSNTTWRGNPAKAVVDRSASSATDRGVCPGQSGVGQVVKADAGCDHARPFEAPDRAAGSGQTRIGPSTFIAGFPAIARRRSWRRRDLPRSSASPRSSSRTRPRASGCRPSRSWARRGRRTRRCASGSARYRTDRSRTKACSPGQSPARPLTLMAATDGNHGRAVARVARWFGLDARIFVPSFVSPGRRQAIEAEGAELVVVDGVYDAAVDAALEAARAARLAAHQRHGTLGRRRRAAAGDGWIHDGLRRDRAAACAIRRRPHRCGGGAGRRRRTGVGDHELGPAHPARPLAARHGGRAGTARPA